MYEVLNMLNKNPNKRRLRGFQTALIDILQLDKYFQEHIKYRN